MTAPEQSNAVEALAAALEDPTRCCSFSDGDGSGPEGWAHREYLRVADELLQAALPAIHAQRDRELDALREELKEAADKAAKEKGGEGRAASFYVAAERLRKLIASPPQQDPEVPRCGDDEFAERKVVISLCGGPLNGHTAFAPDTRPIQLDSGTYRNAGQHPEGDYEFEWEATHYPNAPLCACGYRHSVHAYCPEQSDKPVEKRPVMPNSPTKDQKGQAEWPVVVLAGTTEVDLADIHVERERYLPEVRETYLPRSTVQGLVEALERIAEELGVPGDGYPAPVANAAGLARTALNNYKEAQGG